MEHNGKFLNIEMVINLEDLRIESNRSISLNIKLENGDNSLNLPSFGIYGRNRYYNLLRNGNGSIGREGMTIIQAAKKPSIINYRETVIYEDWMDGAICYIKRSDNGCCDKIYSEYNDSLGRHLEDFQPELVFVQPTEVKKTKSRSLSGSAFIDFPVNKTVIYPDYRNNTFELSKIRATIDSVYKDRDISIVSIWLKGFASPESPYSHNRKLAIGRTEALKSHIIKLYDFNDDIIITEYEPEDWNGLRQYVEHSDLEHRVEILDIIDSNLEPDAKEAKIKRSFPKEYKFLLENCYPALRHTDYRIDYNIHSFNDVEEIKRVLKEKPQNLNLDELYLLADSYEKGSDEYNEVFETAVRLFPNDQVANLNAANAAMRHGDLEASHRYLEKAGESAEAVYTRAALAILEKDNEKAEALLQKASEMGLEKASDTLNKLNNKGYFTVKNQSK